MESRNRFIRKWLVQSKKERSSGASFSRIGLGVSGRFPVYGFGEAVNVRTSFIMIFYPTLYWGGKLVAVFSVYLDLLLSVGENILLYERIVPLVKWSIFASIAAIK